MKKSCLLLRAVSLLVVCSFSIGTVSCGTVLYPERRGQQAGQIDMGIAVLDALGILLFCVPGAIAFAIDFSTGAIYLPPSSAKNSFTASDIDNPLTITVQANSLHRSEIENTIQKRTGRKIDLSTPDTKVAKVVPEQDLAWGKISEVLSPDQLTQFEGRQI